MKINCSAHEPLSFGHNCCGVLLLLPCIGSLHCSFIPCAPVAVMWYAGIILLHRAAPSRPLHLHQDADQQQSSSRLVAQAKRGDVLLVAEGISKTYDGEKQLFGRWRPGSTLLQSESCALCKSSSCPPGTKSYRYGITARCQYTCKDKHYQQQEHVKSEQQQLQQQKGMSLHCLCKGRHL